MAPIVRGSHRVTILTKVRIPQQRARHKAHAVSLLPQLEVILGEPKVFECQVVTQVIELLACVHVNVCQTLI